MSDVNDLYMLEDLVRTTMANRDFVRLFAQYAHRTNQQTLTRFCMLWLEEQATMTEMQYDQRNEASVKLATEICEKVPNRYLPFI
jgi:hypothetical protein